MDRTRGGGVRVLGARGRVRDRTLALVGGAAGSTGTRGLWGACRGREARPLVGVLGLVLPKQM
jgi:hypothetical protein